MNLTDQQLNEYAESHPGDWYSGEWRSQYVDSTTDEMAHYVVKHQESGTVLAGLPDWAGPIALFVADAHDALPALVAEVRRLRAELAQERENYQAYRIGAEGAKRMLADRLNAVTELCDEAEKQATRWEHPLPVPEWVTVVRHAIAPCAPAARPAAG